MKFNYWVSILLLVAVVAGGQTLLASMHIDNAPEVYVPADSPGMVFDRSVREDFPTDETLTALFRGDDLYSDPVQAKMRTLVELLEEAEGVERVNAVPNAEHIGGTEDGFEVQPLLDEDTAAELDIAERRARVLDDRFAPGYLVSEDGDTMVVSVRPAPMDGSLERLELTRVLRSAIDEAGLRGELYGITGAVELDAAQLDSMLRDNIVFLPLTVIVGALLVFWLFRRPLAVVLTLVSLAATTSFTMGLLIALGKPFTMVASIIAPLMTALTVALVVHLFNSLRHASARGLVGRERLDNALDSMRRPALFTSLTTAAGLVSLSLSPIQPIAAFGLVTAVGVLFIYVVVMWLLPPIVERHDKRDWLGNTGDRSIAMLDRFVGACARIGIRHAGWVVAVFVIGLGFGLPQLWRVVAETDVYEFFPPEHELSRATKAAEESLSGVTVLQVVMEVDGEDSRDAFKSPERLALIDDLQQWAEAREDVARSVSLADLIEEMHWAFNGEDPAFRTLPDDQALISQYLFIYDDDDIYEIVNREFDRTATTLSLTVRGANATSVVMDAVREWLARETAARGLEDVRYDLAGLGRKLADQEDLLITGQVRSLSMALLVIFVFMLVLWRSLPMAGLTMVPNTAPIVLIFMLMGFLGIWLDFATAMIASVAVGIAVDDTVHLFHGYMKHRGHGASVVAALGRTYRHAGRAIVITTIILGAQFAMLIFSAFNPTTNFGLLTTVGLISALLLDLLLLPAILVLLGERVKPTGAYARAAPAPA